VSDVLARDESLVDVFVRLSPHFAKLRNRAMRRVMGRLVTIEQAARIAGIPAGLLVRNLNDALGITDLATEASESCAAPVARASGDAALVHPPNAPVVEVDVREDLRAGREPFSKIMAAVGALGESEVLHLRAIFEPAPLFTVLAKRGLVHEAHAHAPDDWSVWFWRPIAESAPEAQATDELSAVDPADPNTVWLDVRGLEPPEPLAGLIYELPPEQLGPPLRVVVGNCDSDPWPVSLTLTSGFGSTASVAWSTPFGTSSTASPGRRVRSARMSSCTVGATSATAAAF